MVDPNDFPFDNNPHTSDEHARYGDPAGDIEQNTRTGPGAREVARDRLLTTADPFAVSEILWAETERAESALHELTGGPMYIGATALTAIACAMVPTEYPGDRHPDEIERLTAELIDRSEADPRSDGRYRIPEAIVSRHGRTAERALKLALSNLRAALKGVEALNAAEEALPYGANMHPVRLAQAVNRRATGFFRGRIPGLL